MVNWRNIPDLAISEIGSRLDSIHDFLNFASVCREWRYSTSREVKILEQKHLNSPIFMFAKKKKRIFGFSPKSSLTDLIFSDKERVFSVGSEEWGFILLPEVKDRLIVSYQDWFFSCNKEGKSVILSHIVSRLILPLPDLPVPLEGEGKGLNLFSFSRNPSSSSFNLAVLLFNTKVYIYKSDSIEWSVLPDAEYIQILYIDNNLYGMNRNYGVVVRDDDLNIIRHLNAIIIPQLPVYISRSSYIESRFAFQMNKKMYLVCKYEILVDKRHRKPLHMMVFEGSIEGFNIIFRRVQDLGNNALFLVRSMAYLIECSDLNGCIKNAVYFTNDDSYYKYKSKGTCGIFNLSTNTIQPLFQEINMKNYLEPLCFFPH